MAHFLILIDCQINSLKVLASQGLTLTYFCVFLHIFSKHFYLLYFISFLQQTYEVF